jgi:transcription antitermination factor NusG
MEQRNWYAICTLKNFENKVCEKLKKKGFQFYCPYTHIEVKSASRIKTEWKPLFNACMFVHASSTELSKVLKITGVVNTLFRGRSPATVTESELLILKQVCQPAMSIQLQKVPFNNEERASVKVINQTHTDDSYIAYKYQGIDATLPSLGYRLTAKLREGVVPDVSAADSATKFAA